LTAEVIKAAAALYYCETKPETTTAARSWVASFAWVWVCVSWQAHILTHAYYRIVYLSHCWHNFCRVFQNVYMYMCT